MKTLHRQLVPAIFLAGLTQALAQPVIIDQPQNQEVPVGGTTTFWVEATGTEPLTYQWFFNSPANPIAGATNETLVITNAEIAQAGNYRVRVSDVGAFSWSASARLSLFTQGLPAFGTITLSPTFQLDGVGSQVDSIAFWEAPDPADTLMIVTAKTEDLLEVWKYPFQGNQLQPVLFPANVNGVAVDQETDLLYVSDRRVSILSLPDLELQGEFGEGIIGAGENNLDILKHNDGRTLIYVSEDHSVHWFDAATRAHLGAFAPPVTSIETVLADDFYQVILVPEEQGIEGSPGVYAYHPDGTPFEKNGTNRLGNEGEFDSDEEGILLYTFPTSGIGDDGTGFIVVTDQKSTQTDFEFFDRQTWIHLGTLRLEGVSNTDGIASTQQASPEYPMGLFAAIDNDSTTAGLGWDVIFDAIGLNLAPRVTRIAPVTSGPTATGGMEFTVAFNKPVTNFNDSADLIITHFGTTHSEAVVTGAGASYNVRVTGINGLGFFLLAVSTVSDVRDLAANALASSVTSVPVPVLTPYHSWALARGLVFGVNADFSDDPDGDHCANIEEFATDGDPLDAAPSGKQRVAIDEMDGTKYLSYTFPARNGAVFAGLSELSASVDGIVYSLAGSGDLISFGGEIVELPSAMDAGLPALNDGWSYHTFRLNQSVSSQSTGFIRMLVGF